MLRSTRTDVRPARGFAMTLHIGAIAVMWTLGANVASSAESWEILLKYQLEAVKCDLDTILSVREVPVGNIVGLEGRVRCIDRREFDFTRDSPNDRFRVRLCEPTVC